MGGKKVECRECGTHWVVVDGEEASLIVDTHHVMYVGHVIVVTTTDLGIGQDMRELETASFILLSDLLAEFE